MKNARSGKGISKYVMLTTKPTCLHLQNQTISYNFPYLRKCWLYTGIGAGKHGVCGAEIQARYTRAYGSSPFDLIYGGTAKSPCRSIVHPGDTSCPPLLIDGPCSFPGSGPCSPPQWSSTSNRTGQLSRGLL